MKKFLLALAVLGATAISSFAQTTSGTGKFSIGVDAALPLGTASDVYSSGFGISLKYEVPIAINTDVTFSGGYEAFIVKSDVKNAFGTKSSYGFVPIKAGLKYYFNQGFFGEAQLGAAFSTESGGGTAFAYSPGIGYTFTSGFEAGVRYEGWSKDGTFDQVALRLAYRF
ncbi:outer membrane beta-barrel protein [Mucilaginibacter sp.]|uniref:outer membrane beta-barrel protein n=1 Tax=Mucilaginibacter sp. TaxID=1882438 RepID=UPI003D0F230C